MGEMEGELSRDESNVADTGEAPGVLRRTYAEMGGVAPLCWRVAVYIDGEGVLFAASWEWRQAGLLQALSDPHPTSKKYDTHR